MNVREAEEEANHLFCDFLRIVELEFKRFIMRSYSQSPDEFMEGITTLEKIVSSERR